VTVSPSLEQWQSIADHLHANGWYRGDKYGVEIEGDWSDVVAFAREIIWLHAILLENQRNDG